MEETKIPLCQTCIYSTGLDANIHKAVDENYKCSLCFGLLSDGEFRKRLSLEVSKTFTEDDYDGNSVVVAVNLPLTMILRESIFAGMLGDKYNSREMNPKNLFSNLLQKDIERNTPLRGSLGSDLILNVTLENDEFIDSDVEYLTSRFSKNFTQRKRKGNGGDVKSMYSRTKIQEISSSITKELASKYAFTSPSKMLSFTIRFEREGIYIGGRYCKFSRALPQSPWIADLEIEATANNSVSEKITTILKYFCRASSTRFISCGREDIDVRMLGNGRPFAVQLLDAKSVQWLRGEKMAENLKYLQNEINKDTDIFVGELFQVNSQEAEKLNVGVEEKRKLYSALCFSTVPLTKELLDKLEQSTPLTIQQNTVVRVLKRRPLHERPRDIYTMRTFQIDDYHFLLKLETQAGTYIKEFVHGDFGRTRPCVGEIMGIEPNQVDILELDVESVDLPWPPINSENGKVR